MNLYNNINGYIIVRSPPAISTVATCYEHDQ